MFTNSNPLYRPLQPPIYSSLLFLPYRLDILEHRFSAVAGVRGEVADIAGDVGPLIEVFGREDTLPFYFEFETADAVNIHNITILP